MDIKLISTKDGSDSLYNADIDECYHSINGAQSESRHIFINAGLNAMSKEHINIFEVGFGTGLNAWLTLIEAERTQRFINYTSIETYPIPTEIYRNLRYAETEQERNLFLKLHECEWNKEVEITPHFKLHKVHAKLEDFSEINNIDLVYFDAFSPEKQPELWSERIFKSIYDRMNEDGVMTTYCSKGEVRRNMQAAGFQVSRLPGPAGKRHITRAVKHNLQTYIRKTKDNLLEISP